MNRKLFLAACALVLCASAPAPHAAAQALSRWALGTPSALIDLPGEPSAAAVAWAERPAYLFFPNSWAAEGGGCRVEVARLYTRETPAEVLAAVGRKLGAESGPQTTGEVSGRPYVAHRDAARTVAVAGADPGQPYGASWVFVATHATAEGAATAARVFESVVIEREAPRNWTLRSLGRTKLCAELPYDLAPDVRTGDAPTGQRYELRFDGMEVSVLQQEQGDGGRFDAEKTVRGIVERNRSKPGVTEFNAARGKAKVGDKQQAELVTMTFRRGRRQYRVTDAVLVAGATAVIATVTTTPGRADHERAARRVLDTLRFTSAVIYGWRPYAVGDGGLYLDLPRPPEPTRTSGSTKTTGVFTGPMAVDVREVEFSTTAYDVDAGAAQMLEFMKAWPGHRDVQGAVEKRLIDGLDARLLRTTHKHAGFTNHRPMLLVYASDRFWAIDAIAAEAEKDYLERIVNSARVQLAPPGQPRQQVGRMGATLLAGPAKLEVRTSDTPDAPDIKRMERADVNLGAAVLSVNEVTLGAEAPPLTGDLSLRTALGIIEVLSKQSGVKLTPTLRDRFEVDVDGVEGVRFVFDITSDRGPGASRGDYLLLRQWPYWWSAFVFSSPHAPESRAARAQIFNSIRVAR